MTISTLLLGGGYTLSYLAQLLDKNSFLITSTKLEKVNNYKKLGYYAEYLDLNNKKSIQDLLKNYSKITQLVDSVPGDLNDPLKTIKNFNEIFNLKDFKKIIYLSTTGVFGVSDGSIVDEATKPNPQNKSSKARLEVENYYRSLNVNTCIFRISAIYGPNRGIGISLKNKTFPLVDNGSRWTNRIHVIDLANAINLALQKDLLDPVYALADDLPSLSKDVVEYYCNKFNFEYPKSITIEEALAKGMYHFMSNQRIKNDLIKKSLNLKLQFSNYKEGSGQEFC